MASTWGWLGSGPAALGLPTGGVFRGPFLPRGICLCPLRKWSQESLQQSRGQVPRSRGRAETSAPAMAQPSPALCLVSPARKPLGSVLWRISSLPAVGAEVGNRPCAFGCLTSRGCSASVRAKWPRAFRWQLSPPTSVNNLCFFSFKNSLKCLLFCCLLTNFLCHAAFFHVCLPFSRVSGREGDKNARPTRHLKQVPGKPHRLHSGACLSLLSLLQ